MNSSFSNILHQADLFCRSHDVSKQHIVYINCTSSAVEKKKEKKKFDDSDFIYSNRSYHNYRSFTIHAISPIVNNLYVLVRCQNSLTAIQKTLRKVTFSRHASNNIGKTLPLQKLLQFFLRLRVLFHFFTPSRT